MGTQAFKRLCLVPLLLPVMVVSQYNRPVHLEETPNIGQEKPTASQHADAMCKSMVQGGGAGNKGILCVGELTNNRLVIITRDFQVYELPLKYLQKSLDKLYINHTTPTFIASKWHSLTRYPSYAFVSMHAYNFFTWVSEDSHNYLFMTIKERDYPNETGIIYDIDTGTAQPGLNYMGTGSNQLISSYRKPYFYGVYKAGSQLMMATYKRRSSDPNNPSSWIDPASSNYYPVCIQGTNQVLLQRDSSQSCTSPDWPVLSGFISKNSFYLFGPSYVISFPEKLWTNPGTAVQFNITDYGNFIQCSGNVPRVLTNDNEDAGNVTRETSSANFIKLYLYSTRH